MEGRFNIRRRGEFMNDVKKSGGRSRRSLLKAGAAAAGFAAQVNRATAQQTGTMAGRKFRAFVRQGAGASVEELKMLPLDEDRVVVRTHASQCCYTLATEVLGNAQINPARIPGHGGVGIVEAVGSRVRRVQVGDLVVVADGPYCGQCYMCLHGRADRCQMSSGGGGNPVVPVAQMPDGTPVIQENNEGGFGELMIPYEWYCMPVFNKVSAVELSVMACTGACGLGAVFGVAPVEPGSDVVVLGCGPLGLSAIQGARIKGASQIIAVEPIRERRELALKLGATMAFDPNAEGQNLVSKIRDLCKGPTGRKFAGGRDQILTRGNVGADYVIEAVGGDLFPPKEPGPDPTGVLPLQQAWDLCSAAGHVTTTAVGQKGNFTLTAAGWSNGSKNHHPGTHNGLSNLRDIPRFARLIETGQFNAKALATSTYPLDRMKDAYQQVADRTTIASVIVFT